MVLKVHALARVNRRYAFTLLELVVVMVVMVILVGAILVAGTTVFRTARIRNTQAVLNVVDQALDQFAVEGPLNAVEQGGVSYRDRYGAFPPDELEPFSSRGLPGSGGDLGSRER